MSKVINECPLTAKMIRDWLMSEDYTDRIIVKEKIISDIKDEHYKNLKENKNGK